MATAKGPKRVRPRPRPSTAAPLSSPGGAAVVVVAGGAALRGPGDDGLLSSGCPLLAPSVGGRAAAASA